MLDIGLQVTAVDGSREMINEASKLCTSDEGKLVFGRVDTIEKTGFGNNYFDGLLCSSVLEYVDDPEYCLNEFHRIVKPEGSIVLTVPNRQCWLRKLQKLSFRLTRIFGSPRPVYLQYSKNHFDVKSFTSLLSKSGFEVQEVVFIGNRPKSINGRWTGALMLAVAKKGSADNG